MITTEWVWIAAHDGSSRGTLNQDGSPMRREAAEAYIASTSVRPPQIVVTAHHCLCCGSHDVRGERSDGWRCTRHWNSNPCQVEGCKRTGSRAKYSETICAQHWRAGVPPGSEARRVWNRLRRIVKRFGWNAEREARSKRLWAWLKHRCQAAARGDLDQREIDRLFGWDA